MKRVATRFFAPIILGLFAVATLSGCGGDPPQADWMRPKLLSMALALRVLRSTQAANYRRHRAHLTMPRQFFLPNLRRCSRTGPR